MTAISPTADPVAVTGASGYIGSWLVTRRLSTGPRISRWQNLLEVVVGFLGAMLAVAVVWLIARLAWGEASLYADPALLTIGVWAVANMFVVPVAGIVILKRRKYG